MVSPVTRRAALVLLAALSLVLVPAASSGAAPSAKALAKLPAKVPTTGAWITASPFDLTRVTAMSRFRSCAGHDYSGTNVAGRRERNRSMKHYVLTSAMWQPAGTVRGYAPFDGTVTAIDAETLPLGRQIRVRSTSASPWEFVFFHADALVKLGAKVKAGQPVAAWPPANAASMLGKLRPSLSFDVALVARSTKGETVESMMLHMTPAVLATYAAKGLTPANLVVPEKVRDAAPCTSWDADPDADYAPAST